MMPGVSECTLDLVQGGRIRRLGFSPPAALQDLLNDHAVVHDHPCGGLGRCGLCRIHVEGEVSEPSPCEREASSRLSCQVWLLGDALCVLPEQNSAIEVSGASSTLHGRHAHGGANYGFAVDLGTSTIEAALCDLETGEIICKVKTLNPQRSFAYDLMGRIGAALEGSGPVMQRLVLVKLRELLDKACLAAGVDFDAVRSMVITGNTAMLYLLTGKDPSSLAKAPFEADCLFGLECEILGMPCYLPPCASAFVGADFMCALLSSGLMGCRDTQILIDVGTNAEMALWKDDRLLVCSAAAGPCFEGVGISCGCSFGEGAVDSVWASDDQLAFHVVGEGNPKGLCGSGLVDAVAAGLELGLIDASGKLSSSVLRICEGMEITQEDIRSFQLAKAAIAAGLQTMINHAQTAPDEISRVFLAGGFGSGLKLDRACAVGLLPPQASGVFKALGNAALEGAVELLLGHEARSRVSAYAAMARCVELGGNPEFNESYIEQMLFPLDDDDEW